MKNDGGSAFPLDTRQESAAVADCTKLISGTIHHGMSLRDWFAGMALNGFLRGDAHQILTDGGTDPKKIIKMIVEDSYEAADAMLAERNK